MAKLIGTDEIGSDSIGISTLRSDSSLSNVDQHNGEVVSQWAAIDRLPTFNRLRTSLMFGGQDENGTEARKMVDVTKLGPSEKHMFMEKLIKHVEQDNLRLLHKMKKRIDKVGVKLPTIEVRCTNLRVDAECEVVHGKPLPTLWNALKSSLPDFSRLPCLPSTKAQICILQDVNCVLKPGRMTLLLGPPGCGKSTLLKALSGNLEKSLKLSGDISYNGYKLEEFVAQKTSAYISQNDLHVPEMTVRESLDFSARCQGTGSRSEIMAELLKREKEAKLIPDPDVDAYMKAISLEGQKKTLQTEYILKILGLDTCADTLYGDAMRVGISGGQKKRLTTGEMIGGPTKALFMDEISNGLDSSTTYQVVCCLQQLAHITNATILVSLLQPAPETFDLFDDIILMGEGKVVYHGARSDVLDYFKNCGFTCPERKGVPDFLQEVISKNDQQQYWNETGKSYSYIPVDKFASMYKDSPIGKDLSQELAVPFDKSKSHKDAISFSKYSLPKWTLFKACTSKEFLLLKRNYFLHVFKFIQLVLMASISMTVFLKSRLGIDVVHANDYLSALYYSLNVIVFDVMAEVALTSARLGVFYKQRDLYFYPAWAFVIPTTIVRIPFSLMVAVVWTSLTYYVIGYSPDPERFFRQILVLFAVHLVFTMMYRFLASFFQETIKATTVGTVAVLFMLIFSGFFIPLSSMPSWLQWAFWVSPLSYGMIGVSGNEFLAPRWQMEHAGSNMTIGFRTLETRGFNFEGHLYWVSVVALFGSALLFNIGFTLSLSLFKAPASRAIISFETLSKLKESEEPSDHVATEEPSTCFSTRNSKPDKGRMVLPFEPINIIFEDVSYYVDAPKAMKEHGFKEKRLQILCNINGAFRSGVLTALMGVSGAGKTTLLDVLSGRKTSGAVEGDIRIEGYPKVQSTFSRISGYCEQIDVHSPQITVEESVIFSAWLRLHPDIESNMKYEFVKEVLETIELDGIKDALVGMPGVDGLSTEQRKRLTIAVELVANPSIIFMDEPTTGLDARSAAIVMRAVKNVANTGRTIVCTIHQPSIDIFESFDELVLLKTGGHMIYSGPLGHHSAAMIQYFEGISGVPKIKDNYNPATWMMEVTSTSMESKLGIEFAQIYQTSTLQEANRELVISMREPPSGSKDLHFATRYSQGSWAQFKTCLWKQHWSYWRSPKYNLTRLSFVFIISLFMGLLYRGQGKNVQDQQSLFNLLGSMYLSMLVCGVNNCMSVLSHVSSERDVFYRERFSGMYSWLVYSAAQVIIEVPYILGQALVFTIITYPMIGYYGSIYKIIWYFYYMFCSLLCFTYLGMLLIAITPSYPVAAISQSAFYTMFNLFSGFLIPHPRIPKWWIWLYYLVPTSWSLNGVLTSQFGDVENEILVFGETKTVSSFLTDYFGYNYSMLPLVAVVLILYPIFFASMFAYSIGKLNFQKR